MTAAANPYVGPRSFEETDRSCFFGREEEIHRLRALAVARRAVLLYSPSGAGKTSLLQAGLLPELRRVPGVVCLPLARLGGEPPEGLAVANLFVFHLLSFLLGEQAEPAEIAALPLAAGLERALGPLMAPDGEPPAAVLLPIDQFEEIFSTAPHRHAERDDFFQQLHGALEAHRNLTLLLALREDWLAHFDPYLPLLPDRLRTRFRLELLSPAQALQAVTEPARREGTPFRPGSARRLVDDLRRTRVLGPDGATVESLGAHVDPVQLQVVCRRLWDRRPAGATEIDEAQIEASGDVDHALADYYAERVAVAAAAAGVPERQVRDWCERSLITPQGIRGQVLHGAAATAGLDNRAVTALVDAHLVRAEPRRGALWYELAHDRLIRPVQEDNAAWLAQHETALEKRAALWELEGRPPRLLLLGRPLTAAQKEAESLGPDPPRLVVDFLAVSRGRQKVRRKWRFWSLSVGVTLAGLGLLVAALFVTGMAAGFGWMNWLKNEAALVRSAHVDRSLLMALVTFELDAQVEKGADYYGGLRLGMPDPRLVLFENLAASADLETILYAPEQVRAQSIAWSPDGRTIFAGDLFGDIRTWDAATGRPGALLPEKSTKWVSALALSPDGLTLASAGHDGALWLRDAHDGRVRQRLTERDGPATGLLAIHFNPDGRVLHAVTRSGTFLSWDLPAGRPAGPPRSGPAAFCAAFSPDGRVYAVCGADGRTHLLTTATGLPVSPPLPGPATGLAFSPDSRTLAAGFGNGSFALFDAATGAPRGEPVQAAAGAVSDLAFAPRGLLAVGTSGGSIQVWDPAVPRPIGFPLSGLGENLHPLVFSPDGTRLASGHGDRIAVWSPRMKPFLGEPAALPPIPPRVLSLRHDSGLLALYGEQAGKTGLLLWAPGAPFPPGDPVPVEGDLTALTFSPDGKLLAAGAADGRLSLLDSATGRPAGALRSGHTGRVNALAFDPSGRLLLSAGQDNRLILQDTATGTVRATATAEYGVHTVAVQPGDQGFAGGDLLGVVFFWDLAGRPRREHWKACWESVQSLVYTADGKTLIAGCQEGTVEIFREAGDPDDDEVVSLPGHSGGVTRLALAPAGKLLASAGLDGQIFLWDVTIPRLAAGPFRGHYGTITALAFDPAGKTLLSIGSSGWSVRWDVDPVSWRRLACRRANRNLEPEEWGRLFLPFSLSPRKLCPDAPERPQE